MQFLFFFTLFALQIFGAFLAFAQKEELKRLEFLSMILPEKDTSSFHNDWGSYSTRDSQVVLTETFRGGADLDRLVYLSSRNFKTILVDDHVYYPHFGDENDFLTQINVSPDYQRENPVYKEYAQFPPFLYLLKGEIRYLSPPFSLNYPEVDSTKGYKTDVKMLVYLSLNCFSRDKGLHNIYCPDSLFPSISPKYPDSNVFRTFRLVIPEDSDSVNVYFSEEKKALIWEWFTPDDFPAIFFSFCEIAKPLKPNKIISEPAPNRKGYLKRTAIRYLGAMSY